MIRNAAAILLIALPIAFTICFALLGAAFGYPGILREPVATVLERFREGGTGLVVLWWCFALTAAALVPLALLVSRTLPAGLLATSSLVIGVLAAAVQTLGLLRWAFLVPQLARVAESGSPGERDAAVVVFDAANRYLGVGLGEHLGYALTGVWTVLIAIGFARLGMPLWLAIVGIALGVLLIIGAFEFVGPWEPAGNALLGALTPIAYTAWSLWLVGGGIWLLIARPAAEAISSR